jgi:drug/metabolite transporter (DMT)-like permease
VKALPARTILLAFLGIVVLGGFNGTAIRLSAQEVAPFWGGAMRFGLAALVFFAIVIVRRISLPRGRALVGSLIYGLLGLGVVFALVYWGVIEAGAGTAQIVLALVPLLTLLLAVGQGIERFRLQSLAGSLVAVVGIALVFVERASVQTISLSLLAILVGAVAIAEANVVVKRFPHSNPLGYNAVAMAAGTVLLLVLSLFAREPWIVPQRLETQISVAYLVVVGSVIVFTLYLIVIERWTASATSYSFLLMPLVSVLAAAAILGEPITAALIVGGALVLVGVYLGAFAPSLSRPLPGLFRRPVPAGAALADEGPPTLISPNCP